MVCLASSGWLLCRLCGRMRGKMQISKQFLIEAVGLILTVSLILTGVRLYQRASRVVTMMEQRQDRQFQQMEEYEIIKYEGCSIDGTTAVAYIKHLVGTYGLPVTVTTVDGTFQIAERLQYVNLRNMESDQYINPLGRFNCEVLRDENSAIIGASLVYCKEGEKQ